MGLDNFQFPNGFSLHLTLVNIFSLKTFNSLTDSHIDVVNAIAIFIGMYFQFPNGFSLL